MNQRHERPTPQSRADHLIWWTDRDAVDAVMTAGTVLPAFVQRLFEDWVGRNAGGRLWSDRGMPRTRLPRNNDDPVCQVASRCGGVVFHRADLDAMSKVPGFITDATMTRIEIA